MCKEILQRKGTFVQKHTTMITLYVAGEKMAMMMSYFVHFFSGCEMDLLAFKVGSPLSGV